MNLPTTLTAVLLIVSSSQPETPQLHVQAVQATTSTPSNNSKQKKHQAITPKTQKHSKSKVPCQQPRTRSKNH